ncbi:MAG: exo-alpha-sialidase [Clostridia bacterium]|nr:exo-alpha-sialidase [Clostridia bacterium]
MKKNRTFRAKVLKENAEINLAPNPVTAEVGGGVTIDLDYHGWPTLHKGLDGTLYAVSSVRKTHVDPYGAIGLTQSFDGGKTWTPYRIIMDTPLDDRDCSLIDLGGGHLMLWWFSPDASSYIGDRYREFYFRRCSSKEQEVELLKKMEALEGEDALGGSFVSHSLDGGKTWSKKARVPVSSPHGPVLMNDGKTLLAAGHYYFSERYDGQKWTKNIHLVCSRDGGYTWERFAERPRPAINFGTPCEPHVLQLRDGTILLAYRDSHRMSDEVRGGLKTCIARSEDGGKTWTDFERVINANGGPPHLYQLSDGKVLLTYSCRYAPACGQRCVVSEDGGKTWSNEMVLSVAKDAFHHDLGYPSSVQLEDGTILTLFYQRLDDDPEAPKTLLYHCSLLLTKWNLIEEAGWYETED